MNNDQFEQAGFSREHNVFLDQEGWVYRATVESFPYLHEHVEDPITVQGDMVAEVVVVPNPHPHLGHTWDIWLLVSEADYVEGPYYLDSEEGQQTYAEVALSRAAARPGATVAD